MAVKTHRMVNEREHYKCQFCNQPAAYWSQNEMKGGRAGGQCIYHCQACRDSARRVAGSLNAKINYRAQAKEAHKKQNDTDVFGMLTGIWR